MWNTNSNYNKFKSAYVQSYIDISGGGVVLRYGSDILFEIGTSTLSGIVSISNKYIQSYNTAQTLKTDLYNSLLTISASLSYISNSINATNQSKRYIYQTKYVLTTSSYVVNIPTHSYSAGYDASGNFSTLNISDSGYTTATNYTSISDFVFTLSGLTYFNNLITSIQTQYSTAITNYNTALASNDLAYSNMMTLSNTIYNNKSYQYLPLYKSLNATLNNYQTQLNTLSSVIVLSNNNLQSQINSIGVGSNYQIQLNTLSSVIVLSNNNLQSQVNIINANTYQTQLNTLSSVIVLSNNNLQAQINNRQTQLNTLSSVIVSSNNNLQSQINSIAIGSYTLSGNVYGPFKITGPNSSILGGHIYAYSTADAYPLFQQLNYNHGNVSINFDMYWSNTWMNSTSTLNGFQIIKSGSNLQFQTTAIATAGTTVSLVPVLTLQPNGNVGIGTTSPNGLLHVILNGSASAGEYWNNNWAVFGNSGTTGSCLGIGYNNTTNTSHITSLAPYVSWRPLIMSANGITFQSYNSSSFQFLGGNVGIGTTSPSYTLDINGTIKGNYNLYLYNNTSTSNFNIYTHLGNYVAMEAYNNGNSVKYPISLNPWGGNVGIGTTSPSCLLEIFGGNASSTLLGLRITSNGNTSTTNGQRLLFTCYSPQFYNIAGAGILYHDQGAISTYRENSALDYSSSLILSSSNNGTLNSAVVINSLGNTTINASLTVNNSLVVGGGFYIGNASSGTPAYIVMMNQDFSVVRTNGYETYSNWGGGVGTVICNDFTGASGYGYTNVNATCFINNSGTQNYSCWNFYSMGSSQTTAVCYNTIYIGGFANTSDRTTKQNIKTLNTQNSLNKILNVRPVNFQYIQQPNDQLIGFISQEVQELSPLATHMHHHTWCDKKDASGNIIYDASGNALQDNIYKLSLNYNDIFVHNVGATQEIYKMVIEQDQRIQNLENRTISACINIGIPIGYMICNNGNGTNPILCSNQNYSIGLKPNADYAYLINAGYKLVVYSNNFYIGSTYTYDNTNGIGPLYFTGTGTGKSCKVYLYGVEITITGLS